ncbi:MAG TPA: LLM class flavin-dependent oxidoreductase [Acidimicrobiia bacterium]|jgi:alkanesulfonate monooxygenase SsuD/methylene tetrahydromethanopterin reductase-like flavin-dependent oxidoreductase (luciferase family)|nr:LLM class flavin-dependent oxidoreductase [Acidimicrobiia bacterium]
MDIGVSLRSGYAPMDARLGARWMVERARAAADAGLDSLFVGDHHNVPVPYYQNVAILGRLLAEWDDRPAGALFLLPLWHPVLLAEQIGTLAAIAQGPFIMQCAVGGGDEQFRVFDTTLRERATRFEAALDIVRALCRGESVTVTDGPWKIDRAQIAPIPSDPVEVWIGGASARAVDRAARMGDAFLIGPEATPTEVESLVASYRDACARHGRAPTRIGVRRDIHVAATDQGAAAVADPILDRGYRGFDPSAVVVGGPARVAAAFAALGDAGCTDVIVRHLADDQEPVLRSFEQLAKVRETLKSGA